MAQIVPYGVLDFNIAFAQGYGLVSPLPETTTYSILASATGWAVTGTLSTTGVFALPNGSAAAPSLNFTNSTTTGLYRSAADVIGIAIAGVPGLAIGATTPTLAAAAGVAGQAVVVKAADGGAGSTTTAGGVGANLSDVAGAGGSKADTGAAAGGNGGTREIKGGAGGNTASAGSDKAGSGGGAGVVGGAGGNATAGTGNGGGGGSVYVQPGDGGTSAGGSAGTAGIFFVKGTAPRPFCENVAISTLADTDATVTVTDMRNGVWTIATGATNRTKTTPTASALVGAFPNIQVGSAIKIVICNLKAANTCTLAGGSGVTGVAGANLVVAAQAAVTFYLIATNVTPSSEAFSIVRAAG